ncbi:hypothetical protein BH10BDE1_BH10BDE1_24860 [soil metagenome]
MQLPASHPNVPVLPSSNHSGGLPAPTAGRAYLLMLSRPNSKSSGPCSTPLATPMLTIGSDASCGLRLFDPSVSARHARIESRGERWTLRDLQSEKGVYMNDTRITEAPLTDLDRIQIGDSVFVFRVGEESKNQLSSKNPEWNSQLDRLPSFSITDFPVLMIGPSGAGKEILATAVHQSSRRRHGPFVTINCSALSESLIESELFGHVRGSFTGATHDRKGAFEIARGGTIFLDEIGDLPLSLQPKLLRALENKEIRPVGSDRSIDTDVRVIAATHKDLEGMVHQGRFREDLYWRLNVCSIKPPALRHRMEDFTDLVYFFCKQMRVRLSFGAIERLREHTWPGNIRELKNVVSRASAYFPGHHIQVEEIETLIDRPLQIAPEALHLADPSAMMALGAQSTGGSVMREIEREMIIRRLVANHGNQRKTAIDLGMAKSTLHDRLKSYSIDLSQIKNQA